MGKECREGAKSAEIAGIAAVIPRCQVHATQKWAATPSSEDAGAADPAVTLGDAEPVANGRRPQV
jgi:hypothetical protein